ncbi:MAG: iron-sulfur cluster assembly protein [Ignavibacteria bacterium]|nr:iron-sulfur cluster assembly protein [Ignavibacteria bacterium]
MGEEKHADMNIAGGDGAEISTIEQNLIQAQAIEAIKTCFDPEIPINIYELGLIYEVKVDARGVIGVTMTLTTPHCPAAQSLPKEVETKMKAIPGATNATVNVVWDPQWNPDMMSDAARLTLGM